MIVTGFGFKLTVVPFRLWTPMGTKARLRPLGYILPRGQTGNGRKPHAQAGLRSPDLHRAESPLGESHSEQEEGRGNRSQHEALNGRGMQSVPPALPDCMWITASTHYVPNYAYDVLIFRPRQVPVEFMDWRSTQFIGRIDARLTRGYGTLGGCAARPFNSCSARNQSS